MEVLRRENSRLVAENNQLHVDVMTATESVREKEREYYQRSKALECQIAELTYWKSCSVKKLKQLEAENEGLRSKIQTHLMEDNEESGELDMIQSLDLPNDEEKMPTKSDRVSDREETKACDREIVSTPDPRCDIHAVAVYAQDSTVERAWSEDTVSFRKKWKN